MIVFSNTPVPVTILGHYFYNFLDSKLPGTKLVTVAQKVLIDQVMKSPHCPTTSVVYFCNKRMAMVISLFVNF